MMTSALPEPWLIFGLPLGKFGRSFGGLGALDVIFLAEHEHDDVGVLLDGARFAEIGKLRPLILAVFDLARQLRERNDRHGQFLGQRFEARGDLGDLLDAVVAARLASRTAAASSRR